MNFVDLGKHAFVDCIISDCNVFLNQEDLVI